MSKPPVFAVLEALQDLPGLGDLSGLKVERPQGGIAPQPFRKHIHRALELRSCLCGVFLQNRRNAQPPKNFSRGRNARLTLQKCLSGIGNVILAKLEQGQREIVLIVVLVADDGAAKNLFRMGGVTQMRIDIFRAEQDKRRLYGLALKPASAV